MSDPTRGITCPDMRRVVREAIAGGWTWGGMSGTTHARLEWKDGTRISFGTTPSVASWKSLATDIKRISGVEVWRKGNRKRSRKADQLSGFTPTVAARETAAWHREHDDEVTNLLDRREALIKECRRLARDRGHLRDIPGRLASIAHIEEHLALLAQPVTPFDPFSLAQEESA